MFACQEEYERVVPPVDIAGTLVQDVPVEGGTYYLTLTYDGEVTVKAPDAWCTAEYLPGTASNNIKITVAPNTELLPDELYAKRRSTGVSILTFSNPTINVQLNQAGQTPPVLAKPEIVGNWQFSDPANFGKAATGQDLVLNGSGFFEAEGINGGMAVEVAKGSYFLAKHGIEANGGGKLVNNYSIMIDFKLPNDNRYCFYQTNLANDDDVDFFLRSNMHDLGIGNVYANLTADPVKSGVWYRLVVSAQLGESLKYYLNGKEIFSHSGDGDAALDRRLAFDPAGVFLFADEDGEDENIYVAQVTIWDQPLEAADVAALGDAGSNDYLTFPGPLVGAWLFEDEDRPWLATRGNDLIPQGSGIFPTVGTGDGDKAVSVNKGSYFLAKHGIPANGENAAGDPGTLVNNYTLLIDFKLPAATRACFFQTSLANDNDVDFFLRANMYELGIGSVYCNLNETAGPIQGEVWYRLVICAQFGKSLRYYLDGKEVYSNNSAAGEAALDSKVAFDPAGVLLFADEDGEDEIIDVAAVGLWNVPLSAEEATALGKAGTPFVR
jgi:hypothetical protein